jgi:hypothetical protein
MSSELRMNELDNVAGGMPDNPYEDAANQRNAAHNGADGTFGGSIGGTLVGGVTNRGMVYHPL